MAERDRPILELRGITKSFPGVLANDHVDFDLQRGEVHALLGENGAGKSTLMNILYGLYHPDEGEIRINGEPIRISSPKAAIESGIGMVHQHFMLIPVMTVAENIVLAVDADLTLVGVVQPVEDVHQGRLPRSVLTEQRVDLAAAEIEVDVVVGEDARKGLGDPAQLEDRTISLGHPGGILRGRDSPPPQVLTT